MELLKSEVGAPQRRSTRLSAARIAVFLNNLSERPNVSVAAMAAGLDRNALYLCKKENSAFAKAWDEAYELGVDGLEEEAERRANKGVKKGIYYKGRRVATEYQYSDVLLMFMLKGKRPDTFRERVEHSGNKGGPINFIIEGKGESNE